MNDVKGKSNSGIKKLQHKFNNIQETISINSIENLSNEFFYELFDYLNGYHIYNAFSNLNYRFQQLLNSSSLLFKIKVYSSSEQFYTNIQKQITLINRHQIFSFNSDLPLEKQEDFFSLFPIDSSLDRLESLTLVHFNPDILMSNLFNLSSLPRLQSLTIEIFDNLQDLTDIYRIVFALPKLKYYNFSIHTSNSSITLPMSKDKQLSTIKYLVIDHPCAFTEFCGILSCTPQLYRLNFTDAEYNEKNNEIISPINPLLNLTHLSICTRQIKFDEFDLFITKIYSKLKFLSLITHYEDIAYLDANRWEKLILKYLPQLEKFSFKYYEYIDYENESPSYLVEQNQFNSSFWIEKKWIFEADIDVQDIVYSVHPYNKQWYEYDVEHKNINSSNQLSKSNRLSVTAVPFDGCFELFIIDINRVLSLTQIYHLDIPDEKIFIGTLIQIIDLLPELNSLKIYSLSLLEPRDLCEEEVDILLSTEDRRKITNVYLKTMIDITEVYFLMAFCPYIEYLKIGCINNIDLELFGRKILNKINDEDNQYLRLLCIQLLTADDEIIRKFDNMINVEKLLVDYTIKRVDNEIYLQWK